ncbi:class I SAM-dependent methyltransferase [Phytoactinopolyspora endophytica]|uniref:class I SAM-dependent methyltransferase n=1 Tax=Phytoactinopolyspora endophytica TaxID=1642495 RepID=UPI00101E020D|nr:class I SAM-dependent methyltransferase [Phytoactinopolyspora endophytica]
MKFDDVEEVIAGVQYMKTHQGRLVYDFLVENKLGRILELGFAHGKSTCYFAAAADEIGGDSHVLTFDRDSARRRSPNIHELLERTGLSDRATPVYAETSYTWELMKLLDQDPQPTFDFAYIDGGHTWDVSGFAFFLVDLLLEPGGWVLFDDLDWTLGGSKHMRKQPWVKELPEEQRSTPQVRKVFELLVKPHPGYVEVEEHDGWGWARKRPANAQSNPVQTPRRGLLSVLKPSM